MGDSVESEMNTLDKYFDKMFHKHIKFGLSDKEVLFIQERIEKIVQSIINTIEIEAAHLQQELANKFMEKYPGHRFISNGNSEGNNIIKVGSFYEQTKNGYPDEFDFIYILSSFEVNEYKKSEFHWLENYFILENFHNYIKEILTMRQRIEPDKGYMAEDETNLCFDCYDRNDGPASKLKFTYRNARTGIKYIYADIVPAFKIIDQHIHLRIREVCHLDEFAEEVITTGSYLITEEVSFTETEVYFIRNMLSYKHRKAYRILKYLCNGNRNGDLLRFHPRSRGITSYMIKVAVIYHHCSCKNREMKVSECVIEVLERLSEFCARYMYIDNSVYRKLNGGRFELRLDVASKTLFHLENMLEKIRRMTVEDLPLSIKPLSILIVTDLENRSSTGQIYRNISTHTPCRSRAASVVRAYSVSHGDLEDVVVSIAFQTWKGRDDGDSITCINRYKQSRKVLNHNNSTVCDPFCSEAPDDKELSVSDLSIRYDDITKSDIEDSYIIPSPDYDGYSFENQEIDAYISFETNDQDTDKQSRKMLNHNNNTICDPSFVEAPDDEELSVSDLSIHYDDITESDIEDSYIIPSPDYDGYSFEKQDIDAYISFETNEQDTDKQSRKVLNHNNNTICDPSFVEAPDDEELSVSDLSIHYDDITESGIDDSYIIPSPDYDGYSFENQEIDADISFETNDQDVSFATPSLNYDGYSSETHDQEIDVDYSFKNSNCCICVIL